MKRALIADLRCPYCAGALEVASEIEADAERLRYGLLRCRCFEFPIVDGVLLLKLAGDCGPRHPLEPYVPLLVAAVQHLQKNDAAGLRDWLGRHAPLVCELLEGGPEQPYLSLIARLEAELQPQVLRHLQELGRYDVVGVPPARQSLGQSLRRSLASLRRLRRRAGTERQLAHASRSAELAALTHEPVSGFFAPPANALALRLGTLPLAGRLLSLGCGQGAFENLLGAMEAKAERVSLDASLLEILIARRYADRGATFIVHDAAQPLPFRDGAFDGVFSAGALPGIAAQKSFVHEAIRVTAPAGWTFFDAIASLESGAVRIDGARHAGFCRNYFARLEDYAGFLRDCAGANRQIGIDVPRPVADYRDSGRWMFEPGEIDAKLKLREAAGLSALVVEPKHFTGFEPAAPLRPMKPERLSLSPAFEPAQRHGDELRSERRPQFARADAIRGAPRFGGYPERLAFKRAQLADPAFLLEQFCAGTVVFLPKAFDRDSAPLSTLLS